MCVPADYRPSSHSASRATGLRLSPYIRPGNLPWSGCWRASRSGWRDRERMSMASTRAGAVGAVLAGSVVLSGLVAPAAVAGVPAAVNAPKARVHCPDWKFFDKVRGNRITCAVANDMMWVAMTRARNRKLTRKYGWYCNRLRRPNLPPTEEKWLCGPFQSGYLGPGTGMAFLRFSVRIDVN